ncbi:MAG: methyltransferase domain-containing protein [Gammaproteobacteria bacterium]|nr:methyltransferase domain-containing protein [Gammaproteobacteria bacterium]
MNTQIWDPARYRRDAGFVAALGAPLLTLLAPGADERILDLGCGDGTLTQQLVASGATVVAVDASAEQIAAARALGLDAQVVDGHALPFQREFDAVFSNAALHWMLKPTAVVAGIARALKLGGRFVAEMGGYGNVASVVTAFEHELARAGIDATKHNPWYFPTPAAYSALLEAAGFEVLAIDLFQRPTPLPGDVVDWLQLMAQTFTAAVPKADQPELIARVRHRLEPTALRQDGVWELDYVRLRVHARLIADVA